MKTILSVKLHGNSIKCMTLKLDRNDLGVLISEQCN